MALTLTINGKTRTVDAPDLKGTKFGCGVAACGACTVHIDGKVARSCVTPASSVVGQSITTVEGIGSTSIGQQIQKAWLDIDVLQCGYCQAGQIMAATALLQSNPKPTDKDIDAAMQGNACRCATYLRIRAAIKQAAGLPITDTREA
jgi:isoquinoline 1-oxidoreductase alpha subunit